jgi:Zn-dependent protease
LGIHEYAHALSAFKLGDDTAKKAGRLTLNPFKHIDLIGTVLMPIAAYASGLALIGWAKPVPVNPNSFVNKRLGDGIVSFLGPLSNLSFALMLFTLVLIFPSSSIFEFRNSSITTHDLLWYGVFLNVFLGFFNLLPIPPLDGAHILHSIFYNRYTEKYANVGFIGSFALLIFIYSPLWRYFIFVINSVMNLLINISNNLL